MTALTRRTDWNPWRDFFNLDELLAHSIEGKETQLGKAPIDFYEDENKYTLLADFPGVKKEDLKVEFKEGVLTLTGTRHQEVEEKKKNGYYRQERHYGRIERQLNLGEKVDLSRIEANFEGGVLKMTLPKKNDQKTHTVKIT